MSPAELPGNQGEREAPWPGGAGRREILAPRVRAGLLHTCRGV